jgi:quercetin dioxygenase-like cupin family protein
MGGQLLSIAAMPAVRLPAGGTLRTVGPADHGLGAFIVTTSEHPSGEVIPVHKHPFCGEIFVVTGGVGRFEVDGEIIVAEVGDMVVVPPDTWHGFRAEGGQELRLVAMFDAAEAGTVFADPALAAFNTA